MKGFLINLFEHNYWFGSFATISIILIISSFIVPPVGIIDGSVLAAVGELFAFAALGLAIKAVDKGVSTKVRRGDTSISFDCDKERDED